MSNAEDEKAAEVYEWQRADPHPTRKQTFLAGAAHGRKAEGQRIWIECMKNVNPMNLEYEEKLKRIIFGEGEK